jgi:hypothetical protein
MKRVRRVVADVAWSAGVGLAMLAAVGVACALWAMLLLGLMP